MGIKLVGVGVLAWVVLFSGTSTRAEDFDAERKCAAAEFRAMIKQLRAKAQCHERSLRLGIPVDQDCLNRVESRQQRMLTKVHRNKACQGLETDEGGIRFRIDEFLREARSSIDYRLASRATPTPIAPTPTPSPEKKEKSPSETKSD